jgi:glycosyltransferase involved in cell wall biosynthesis
VVLSIGQLGLGGAERQLVLLAAGLRRAGTDVSVLTHRGGPRESELAEAGVPVHVIARPGRRHVWPWLPLDALRMVRLLRRLRPQVVHAYLYHSYVLMAPLSRLARVPVYVAGRRSLGHYKAGHRVKLFAERLATRLTDAVVANSRAVAEETVRQEGMDLAKLHVLHNALPPSAFAPVEPTELDLPSPRVVCVANLIDYKGHRYLVEAMERLREEGLGASLILVGDGRERAHLEEQVRRSGVPTAFLGARQDVPAILAASDVFVLPSLQEGMSNAVMEAMAAGLPVVVTDVGGNSEAVAGNGLMCAPADAGALADHLRGLLTDDARRADLGKRAREHAEGAFGLDALVTGHLTLYGQLLENKRCAG